MDIFNALLESARDYQMVAWISLAVSAASFYTARKEKKENSTREQAIKVSSWIEDSDDGGIIVANNSDLPIYGVAIVVAKGPWFFMDNEDDVVPHNSYYKGSETVCRLIPPGKYRVPLPEGDYYGCSAYPTTKIAFVCANGTSWVRETNGKLYQTEKDPLAFFHIERPYHFTEPQLVD